MVVSQGKTITSIKETRMEKTIAAIATMIIVAMAGVGLYDYIGEEATLIYARIMCIWIHVAGIWYLIFGDA